MGKRYGRNQKRKHRLKIQMLEKKCHASQDLINYQSKQLIDIRFQFEDFLREFKRWWKNSVLLDPEIKRWSGEIPPYFKMVEDKPLIPAFPAYETTTLYDMKEQALEALRVAVEHDLGQRHMHILLALGNNQYRYYIDERALYSFEGMPEKMIKQAFKQIVYAFKEKFRHDSKRD